MRREKGQRMRREKGTEDEKGGRTEEEKGVLKEEEEKKNEKGYVFFWRRRSKLRIAKRRKAERVLKLP